MKDITILVIVVLGLLSSASGQDRFKSGVARFPDLHGNKTESPLGPSTEKCRCIRNENGECMNLSSRMPAYSRGSGIFLQMLPNCIENCLPGYVAFETATFHPMTDTAKEMEQCLIDWKRLERINPQWRDPNWTP